MSEFDSLRAQLKKVSKFLASQQMMAFHVVVGLLLLLGTKFNY